MTPTGGERLAPGIFVEEVPAGRPPVRPAPTGVAAFVAPARRGPLDSAVEVRSRRELTELFGGPWARSGLAYAVRAFFANGGARAVVVRVAHPDHATAALHVDRLRLMASSPGSWGDRLQATVDHDTASTAGGAVTLTLTDGRRSETFALPIAGFRSALEQTLAASRLVRAGGPLPEQPPAPGAYAVASADRGSDGSPVTSEDYVGPALGEAARGLSALDEARDVDVICLPPPARGGDVPESVWAAAAAYAAGRGAMLLADPPAGVRAEEAAAWSARAGLSGEHAGNVAVYVPRVRRPARRAGDEVALAPSGAVAGVIARTDAAKGVWKAPAGAEATLVGMAGLDQDLDSREIEELVQAGINPLRDLPGHGPVVWGARTLAGGRGGGSEQRLLPVRRLALHIERSLASGLAWTVFEPNDEPLWQAVRSAAEGVLLSLFRQGALAGSSAREAYVVHCGRDTTTQADIDAGRLRLQVGFAPLRPAEFIIINVDVPAATPP